MIAVDYARATIKGFTESGDPVLTLNVGRQRSDTLRGSAGLELRGVNGDAASVAVPSGQVAPSVRSTSTANRAGWAQPVWSTSSVRS